MCIRDSLYSDQIIKNNKNFSKTYVSSIREVYQYQLLAKKEGQYQVALLVNITAVSYTHLKVLDYDTGGGEFLLSLNHPFARTAATEGFEPNVRLCQEKLLPLGIDFKECNTPSRIPYDNCLLYTSRCV